MYSDYFFQEPENQIMRVLPPLIAIALTILGFCEAYDIRLFEYSKFSRKKEERRFIVSSRKGMVIWYIPSFLVALVSLLLLRFPHNTENGTRVFLVNLALTIHFFKRIMEVLFVHKYSGVMPVATTIMISISYMLVTLSMVCIQHMSLGYPKPAVDLKAQGFLLFLLGISGNFYHHFLLSKLRNSNEKDYKIPKGGLFGFVVCPHYLFEILAFFGLALISQTMYWFCFNLGSAMYLIGRSYATRKWYLSKFKNFPKDVKAIFPFVL